MLGLTVKSPRELSIDPDRLKIVYGLMDKWTRSGELPAAALCLGRGDGRIETRIVGRRGDEPDSPSLKPDALFLIASLTKPVTAVATMILVERGLLTLDDPVADYIKGFARNGKGEIRVRHILTHTSGLPDMVPNNDALRASHAPLSKFIEEIVELTPTFAPGAQVSYQSAGFALQAEIVHQITGKLLPEFLRAEVFEPLGMNSTSLGIHPERASRQTWVRISEAQKKTDWNWNTPYWLNFGAPWGGLITSPDDYGRLLRCLLNGGILDDSRILSPNTVRAMTTNRIIGMTAIPEEDRKYRPWGLGWRLNWPWSSSNFGDILGAKSFGHWGATGTLAWADPDLDAFVVIYTNRPQETEGRYLARLSNAAAACFV